MKRLFLTRHSKAEQGTSSLLGDHKRKLSDKGVDLGNSLVLFMDKHSFVPQVIYSSDSERTSHTAKIVNKFFDGEISVHLKSELYMAESTFLLTFIQNIPDIFSTVMIVGHNPGLEEVASLLSGEGNLAAFRDMKRAFTPPAMAVIDFPVNSWNEVAQKQGKLIEFYSHKVFK
jgi:phosphohistidine phosphatase